MNLNDLLLGKDIDPKRVLVLRHRPHEPELRKVLPWLAAERHELFNAYQRAQGEKLEQAMRKLIGNGYVASFIGCGAGKGLFVGLYSIAGSKKQTLKDYWRIPANVDLKAFGMRGRIDKTRIGHWFELVLANFYTDWKGKLVVKWPPPERSWWRRAHRNEFPVVSVFADSALDAAMPEWDAINLTWGELGVIPTRWKSALSQWRGIYYIFDGFDSMGYVGAAYGSDNILGRWLKYAKRGHGGNRLLRQRDPKNFRFTILQRVSPDMDACDVIYLESSWKERLHTRPPHGLNDN